MRIIMARKALAVTCFLLAFSPSQLAADNANFSVLGQELDRAHAKLQDAKNLEQSVSDYFDGKHNAGSTPDSFMPCSGRLSLESNVPVTTTNQVGLSTVYFVPYQGSKIALYNGTTWSVYEMPSQLSITLTGLTSGSNYDVFVLYNSATSPYFFLELSDPWTNATTRADALVLQDGVWVKSADHTQRFLGTFQATSATTAEDSAVNRLLWNFYNRHPRYVAVVSSVSTWAGGAAGSTWRAADNNTANSVKFLVGDADAIVFLRTVGLSLDPGLAMTSIGIDSATATSSLAFGVNGVGSAANTFVQTPGFYFGQPGLGSHTAYWLEMWDNSAATWYGTDGNTNQIQAGMFGWVDG
jgi:hypothetical protein